MPRPYARPHLRIDSQWNGGAAGKAHEGAVILKPAESEKAAQERQGMIGQGLVYEWVLPFQCLSGATTRLLIVIKGGIHDIRVQVHDGSKA